MMIIINGPEIKYYYSTTLDISGPSNKSLNLQTTCADINLTRSYCAWCAPHPSLWRCASILVDYFNFPAIHRTLSKTLILRFLNYHPLILTKPPLEILLLVTWNPESLVLVYFRVITEKKRRYSIYIFA